MLDDQQPLYTGARKWWDELTEEDREAVGRWLERNPMPADWNERWTPIDWAYTEMPVGFGGLIE